MSPPFQYDPYNYTNDYDLHTGKCPLVFFKHYVYLQVSIQSDSYCSSHLLLCQLAGDPKADLAYERQYEQQTYHVIPEVIKNFLQYFHKTISDLIDQKVYELQSNRVSSESIEQKIYEIQDVYENRCVPVNKAFLLKDRHLNTMMSSSPYCVLLQLE